MKFPWDARDKRKQELDAEIDSHLQMSARDREARGESAVRAAESARRELGNAGVVREVTHDQWRLGWLEALAQDVRYGLRMLRKNPGFTATAVLTLALGIGANAAIFTLLDAVVLRTLPVANPHELVFFSDNAREGHSSGSQTGHWFGFSSQDFAYFRDHNESFKELCAIQSRTDQLEIRVAGASGPSSSARGSLVSGNFFSFLGLNPAVGRLFTAEDDRPGTSPTAVLNYPYWTRKFRNNPSAIGQVIEINGTAFTIIGATILWSGLHDSRHLAPTRVPAASGVNRALFRGSARVLAEYHRAPEAGSWHSPSPGSRKHSIEAGPSGTDASRNRRAN